MINEDVYQTAVGAIELATRAPSIHNSQPWQCAFSDDTLRLYAATDRWLPATDADRRDLMLSCGAMLHHLVIALRATGLQATVHRMPNPAEEEHVATLELREGRASDDDITLTRTIGARRTDRRPFTTWEVPDPYLARLTERAADQGAVLRVIGDGGARQTLLAAIGEAAAAQRKVPGYETELAMWTGRSVTDEGVPAANLLRSDSRHAEAARDFPTGELSVLSQEPDGAVLLVLGTASDDRLSQLRAGEAMSAVLLQATDFGLASCPLSQPLEVPSARRVLQDQVLGGTLTPQLVFRVGFAPDGEPLPATPRRPVRDLLRSEPS